MRWPFRFRSQRGRIHLAVRPFFSNVVAGELSQMVVDERGESIECLLIAAPPGLQERGDLGGRAGMWVRILPPCPPARCADV
jgi:hypothetical protein